MICLVTGMSTIENALRLVGLIIVFVLILVAAYFTSRIVGGNAVANTRNRNMKVIETFKVAPNRFLQIIEVSGKYILIGVGKDTIEFMTELDPEMIISNEKEIAPIQFKDMFDKIKDRIDNNKISKG